MLDTKDIIGLACVPVKSSSSHSWQESGRLQLTTRELAEVFPSFFFFFFFNQILKTVATSKFKAPPNPKIENWGKLLFLYLVSLHIVKAIVFPVVMY